MVHRILGVEDAPHIREFLVEFLSAFGHRVESAGNGSEAFTLLGERSFALILADLQMPEMDGEALYQKIVQTWPHLASRVVFLTSGVPSSSLDVFSGGDPHPAETIQSRRASAPGRADALPKTLRPHGQPPATGGHVMTASE
jgi:two-component system NtrC family sensor kinase